MNIKQKIKNKTFVLAMLGAIVAFVYQICGMFGIVPPISESDVTQIIGIIVNLLVGLGILINPNTDGIGD